MLKNRFFAPLIVLFAALSFSTQGLAQQLIMADKVVAVVGGEMILYSDLVQTSLSLQEQRRAEGVTSNRDPISEALEHLLIQKVLYNQARLDSIFVALDDLQDRVDELLQEEVYQRGSQQAVERFYHKPIYEVRSDMITRYEEMRYAYYMEMTVKSKTTITSGEVSRYYKRMPQDSLPMIPEQYIYSQIFCYPPAIEEAKLRTRTRLLEMRERIMGGAKFETLARMYSEDPGTSARGGEMGPMQKESLVTPFADALVKLKPGQISEVVETEFGFHIIQMIEKTPSNQYRFRHILLKPTFTIAELEVSFTKLDSVKTEIREGRLTFPEAAAQFSDDKFSKNNGGIVSNLDILEAQNNNNAKEASTYFRIDQLPPEVARMMKILKPGGISEPFASQDLMGNQMTKIIQLNQIIPAHQADLNQDFNIIEELVLQQKQEEEYGKWLSKTILGMFIRIDDEFKGCRFENQALQQ